MKPKSPILAVLCMLMLLSAGCGSQTDKPVPTGAVPTGSMPAPTGAVTTEAPTEAPYEGKSYVYDYRPTTLAGGAFGFNNNIVETDDSVFLICNGYLYFSDREYHDFMPLCPRPDCMHNDDDCDARLDTKNGIWLYGNYIWYVTNERGILDDANKDPLWLCRTRIDGTKHERVLCFYEGDYDFTVQVNSWIYFYSNRYLYASHSARARLEPGAQEARAEIELYIIDLETLEMRTAKSNELGFSSVVWGDGDLVYGIGTEDVEDPDYDGEQTLATGYRKTLLVHDLKNDELKRIGFLDGRGFLDMYSGCCGLYGSEFRYLRWDRDADTNNLWAMDIETGECRLVLSKPVSEFRALVYDWTNNVYFASSKRPGEEGFYAYSLDGTELVSIPYDGMPRDFLEGQVMFQTDSYIFLCPKPEADSDGFSVTYTIPTWYLDKRELGTEGFGWKRWEP